MVLNWSAEPGLVSAARWRVTLSYTSRAATCLLQEKTESVGVPLDRHLQDPWVFPPAMTHRGSEDGSVLGVGTGHPCIVLQPFFSPGMERVASLA